MKKFILLSIVSLSTFISAAQCVADFTWSVSGSTVQFTNSSSGTTNSDWSFGDGSTSTTNDPTHNYSTPGTYTVCLSAYYADSVGGFCYDSICQQITVFQDSTGGSSCNADFTWSVSGNTVLFTNTSTGTNMDNWSFGDGNSSTATDPSHIYAGPGSYWVCLYSFYSDSTITCEDSVCYQIVLSDSLDSTASAPMMALGKFQLFPNPVNEVLNLKFDQLPINAHATITDLVGREMLQVELSSQVTEINVADLPKGIYLLQLSDSNNQLIGLQKFLRE